MITLCPEFRFRASLRSINAWLTFGQRFGMESNALGEALTIILQVKVELPFSYAYCVSTGAALIMEADFFPDRMTHGRINTQGIVVSFDQCR
jgi:hypothetical protein